MRTRDHDSFEKGKIEFGEERGSGDEIRYWCRRVIAGSNSAGEREISRIGCC